MTRSRSQRMSRLQGDKVAPGTEPESLGMGGEVRDSTQPARLRVTVGEREPGRSVGGSCREGPTKY